MGPPPFGDGYFNDAAQDNEGNRLLQWGHRLSVMDIAMTATTVVPISMLQWGHRLSVMDIWLTGSGATQTSGLQWGHRLSVMDIRTHHASAAYRILLQWGHRLSVMDIGGVGTDCSALMSFNGATAFR